MIDHLGLSVSNYKAAKEFYDKALMPIGVNHWTVPEEFTDGVTVGGYGIERPVFWIHDGEKQTPPIHVAFKVENRALVDLFYEAAIAAGGEDNGAPGLRPEYHENYYGAFVRDPDGHNIEVVCHEPE